MQLEIKNIGEIISLFEKSNLTIKKAKLTTLAKEKAEAFLQRNIKVNLFLTNLLVMTSGPIMVLVLEGQNAVEVNRRLMGATNQMKRKTVPLITLCRLHDRERCAWFRQSKKRKFRNRFFLR